MSVRQFRSHSRFGQTRSRLAIILVQRHSDPTEGVRFGLSGVVQTDSTGMAAFGRFADIQPGRMSALIDAGRSEVPEPARLNGSYRPQAVIRLLLV